MIKENYNKFGSKMILLEYRKYDDCDVLFEDYNFIVKNTRYDHFKDKSLKCPFEARIFNKGFMGHGKYSYKSHRLIYSVWCHMLERCYDDKYKEKYPTYKDCKVCEEWLNFQNFAKWYEENYYEIPNEKMCLDKDILIKGNIVYSPETCLIVPNNINVLFTKSNKIRGDCPLGVSYRKDSNKFKACCNIKGKRINLGSFSTKEEAFKHYKIAKEKAIKEIADKYKNQIPKKLYDAMYNYEVEITD